MKKSAVFALVLIVAAILSVAFATEKVNQGKEKIVITQEVLSGDPESAAGVTLRIPSHWDGRLLWETEYLIGGGGGAESAFSFLSRQARWGETREKGISIYFESGMFDLGVGEITEGTSRSRILVPDRLTMEELFRRTEEKGIGESLTVRIGDYYDFYPVFMWLEGDSVGYEGDYGEVLDYLTGYFHILVGEDRWEITAEKAGDVTGISAECWEILGEEQLSAASVSALGKEGFYFSYDVQDADSGRSVNRGQNKGIFFFPYARRQNTVGQIDLTQVRKLCGLPEDIEPLEMLADEEEGQLYLAARDAQGYSLLVYEIEAEGLRLAEEVPMNPSGRPMESESASAEGTADRETSGGPLTVELKNMSFCEGGILVTWSHNGFCFMVKGEKGHRIWCQGAFPDPGERTAKEAAPFPDENVCVFDGERLVLAAYERRGSLNVVLAVYGQEGERYGGLYRHSSEGDWDGVSGSPEGILPQGDKAQMLGLDLGE